jgi:hypothetical protein
LDTTLTTLLCKKVTVGNYEEVKTGCKLAGSSKEGCGSKRDISQIIIIIIIIIKQRQVKLVGYNARI